MLCIVHERALAFSSRSRLLLSAASPPSATGDRGVRRLAGSVACACRWAARCRLLFIVLSTRPHVGSTGDGALSSPETTFIFYLFSFHLIESWSELHRTLCADVCAVVVFISHVAMVLSSLVLLDCREHFSLFLFSFCSERLLRCHKSIDPIAMGKKKKSSTSAAAAASSGDGSAAAPVATPAAKATPAAAASVPQPWASNYEAMRLWPIVADPALFLATDSLAEKVNRSAAAAEPTAGASSSSSSAGRFQFRIFDSRADDSGRRAIARHPIAAGQWKD